MPPHATSYERSSSESESGDEPEAISLSQSKKDIQKRQADQRTARETQQRVRKEKNRELDRKLKERCAINKSNQNVPSKRQNVYSTEGDDDGENLATTLQEAEDEDEEPFSYQDEEDSDSDEQDDSGSNSDDPGEGEMNADPTTHAAKPPIVVHKPDHLPDELFEIAFSTKPTKRKEEGDIPVNKSPKRRKRSKSESEKEIIVGSRAIRILSDSPKPSMPPRNVTKFLDRTLALKPGKRNPRGWERKPVNIGVLRQPGPAVSFVRRK